MMTHDYCKSGLDELSDEELSSVLLAQAQREFYSDKYLTGFYSLGLLRIESRDRGLTISKEVDDMNRLFKINGRS